MVAERWRDGAAKKIYIVLFQLEFITKSSKNKTTKKQNKIYRRCSIHIYIF